MSSVRFGIGGVVVVAVWAIAVAGAVLLPMTDPDTWWHIRVGRDILATGAIPQVDSWSLAGERRPWVSQDWASNVLLAALFDAGGSWGVTLVSLAYGAMAALGLLFLWDAIGVRRPTTGWLARSSWLLVGIVLAAPVLGARVQVVDLLLAAATLNVAWRQLAAPRRWHPLLLPALAVAWVNLHAGFPLLFLIGGAVVVGELLDRFVGRRPDGDPMFLRSAIGLAVGLVAAVVALVANPNGLAIYGYPMETLGLSALGSFIGEWQPARFSAPAGQLLALFIVAGVAPALMFGRYRLRAADALVLVGLTYMAVTAVRFLLVVGPIGSAVVCVTLAPILSESRVGRSTAGLIRRLTRAPAGAAGLINAGLVAAIATAGVGLSLARVAPDAQDAAIRETFPVEAVAWLSSHKPGERIFNRYEWGGYLGLQLPHRPIFIDGRADVYDDRIIRDYVETISVNDDPQSTFDRFAIDHVLYPADSTLGRWLGGSETWRLAYQDEVASVWVRD